MKKRGSITIYLSIVLVSVILVVSVVSESGRVNAIQTKSRSAAYMAAESVSAGYAKQIYEDYGVLLVWENEPVEEQLKKYIQDNINMTNLKGESIGFTKSNLIDVIVNGPEYVVEDGKGFTEQIISYTKYAGTVYAVTELVEKFDEYSDKNKVEMPENNDVTNIVDKGCDELIAIADKIDKLVAEVKDTHKLDDKFNAASRKLEILKSSILNHKDIDKKTVKKFLKLYRELITELDRKASEVDSAIKLIKQYDEKKELFLKENGYATGDGDYIDENLKILENVKDRIKENKELAISKYSDVDSKNIETVSESIKNMKTVKNKLESLEVNETTEEDKKNQSIYESAVAFLKKGVLSLVVEDVQNISDNAISLSNLPTSLIKKKEESSLLKKIKNKAFLALYSEMKFGNYLKCQKNTALKYEMEYIIGGQTSDVDNLMRTVEKIVAARNVMNLSCILSDKEKMTQISAISSSATASIGLPFLEPIIKSVLTEAWALAESVSDVKGLLNGKLIPLIKNKKSWNTSLENLFDSNVNNYKGKEGLDYVTYLMMLIMLEDNETCVYRIMDLIQVNVQKRYNKDFIMAKCFQEVEFTATFEINPLFAAMPLVVRGLSENNGDYEYEIKSGYSY